MIEKQLIQVLAPVVDEINIIKNEIETLKSITPKDGTDGKDGKDADPVEVDIEEVAQVLKADQDFITTIKGERGEKGESIVGERGADGQDGLGIELKQWESGVYREGTYVTSEIGKIYKSLRDTADKPGHSGDWERIGSSGFAWKGLRSVDAVYENGDLYIDNGSTFIWWNGKGNMFTQRGKAGSDGKPGEKGDAGQDAAYVVAVKADAGGFHMAMSDGEVHTADIEGFDSYLDTKMETKLLNWLDAQTADDLKFGTPIKIYRGQWMFNESYTIGDAVNYQGGLWLCHKHPTIKDITPDFWVQIAGQGGGGGGGGGGGVVRLTQVLADGQFSMAGFGIGGLADPRSGTTGAQDAVNKQAMQAAIAAGSLYQGTYKPAIGSPNIPQLADTVFTAPVAGTETNKPAGSSAVSDKVKNLDVWFNLKGKGLDNFLATLAAPLQLDVTFSDGTHHSFLLPAATYADVAAVERAMNTLATGTAVKAFHGFVNGSDFWLGVETEAPLYATSIVGQAGGGFPLFTPGAASTVLNTYNWVVSTVDPNVPEYMPPGLPGIPAGTKVNNSDLLQYNAKTQKFEIIRGGNLTQNFADQRYWQLQAGNMAWVDQPYNKGAVVYGTRFNAWFVATQNIVAGSAEPGSSAAGAIWRKINSTYGSTIFFGRGDYDTAHTDAAHNWGMPAGTYPAGQQPLNGDSYYDITSGSEVQFVVTQNPPLFTLSGIVGVGGNKQGADLGNADLANFPGTRTALALPAYWQIVLGTAQTPTTGAFAGKTFAAGTYLIGFSGDPDADNGGWFMVLDTPGNTSSWTINTPHPQVVPDTITPKIVWGYKRKFNITIGAAVTKGQRIRLIGGMPSTNGLTEYEIRQVGENGSTYSFAILTVQSGEATIAPIAIKSQNPHFERICVNFEVGQNFELLASIGDGAPGKQYEITVTTYDYDLSLLHAGTGSEVVAAETSSIKADGNYPSEDLNRLMRAQSGDPTASLAAGQTLGVATNSPQLDTTAGLKSTWDFYGDYTGKTGLALNFWEARFYKGAGGSACDMSQAIWQQRSSTKTNATSGAVENRIWDIGGDTANGYINLPDWNWPVKAGTKLFCQITFDTRDPKIAIYHIVTKYVTTDGGYVKVEGQFTLAVGNFTQRISFYPWNGGGGSTAIPAIAYKS